MRIIHKLLLGFLIVVLLIWAIGYFAINTGQKALQKTIGKSSVILARETLDKIDRHIYDRIERWRSYCVTNPRLKKTILASKKEFEKLDNIQEYIDQKDKEWIAASKEEITPFMQELINKELSRQLRKRIDFYKEEEGYSVFAEVFVTNKYGANVAQTGKTTDYYQADEEWWQMAKKDGLSVADVEYDRSADVYSTDIGIRINDENGNFLGIMKVVLNIEEVTRMIEEVKGALEYKTVSLELLTKAGKLIYDTEPGHEIFEDVAEFALLEETKEHEYFLVTVKPGEDEELLAHAHSKGYRDYKGLGWILVVEHETKEIFAPITKLRNTILVVSLVVTILAVLLGIFISISISNPIGKLKSAAIEIGKGNLGVPIEVKSRDEVGQLATSFKKMTEDLKRTTTSVDNLNREIAKSKRLQEQLIQREKMASLGVLAAGVAHEIKTPWQSLCRVWSI